VKKALISLFIGLILSASPANAQSDPEAAHEAVMMAQSEGLQALNEAENASDTDSACDAYRRAQTPLKTAANGLNRLIGRLDKRKAEQADLSDHLKDMLAENKTALSTAEAGIRRTCRK
jgi:uncharacterized protein (UPF0335 family)